MKFLSKLSRETLICNELRVKEYKNLLKCIYGEDVDTLIFVETLCDILSVITNKPTEYFKQLSIVDMFCLILDVRINSLSNICKVVINNENKKMNLEMKLDYIKTELEGIFDHLSSVVEQDNVQIHIECPSVNKLLYKFEEPCLSFIKSVSVKSNKDAFNVTTKEQVFSLLEKISPKLYLQIVNASETITATITSLNFLARYRIKTSVLSFEPTLDYLLWFVKLIFNESLETLYTNLFYLSHLSHMNTEYVEQSAVGEYNYFVGCLKGALASNDSSSESQTIHDEYSALST